MIWLTWRQFRLRAATATAVVAAFGVLLAVTGPLLAGMYAHSNIGTCHGGVDACGGYADDFLQQLVGESRNVDSSIAGLGSWWLLYLLGIVIILVAPAIIGIFWGAPLIAGEFESGTHYVAWTQSITRTRWLAIKLTLVGLAAMVATEALSLMQTWWAAPISLTVARGACCNPMAMNQYSPLLFATRGVTPLGYAAFAFALGVTVGVLVRRAVPAMAITLAVFAALQIVMPLWVRPSLFTPVRNITTISSWGSVDVFVNGGPGGPFTLIPEGFAETEAWILSIEPVNTAGTPVTAFPAACMPAAQSGKDSHIAMLQCLDGQGIRIAITYQPASRYWAFQWTETAIYVALTLALIAYTSWRIRARHS